jgi:hypothetical protein
VASASAGIKPFTIKPRPVGCVNVAIIVKLKVKVKLSIKLEDSGPLVVNAIFRWKRIHCGESVVKDNVVLRAYFARGDIHHQRHERGVYVREANKHSKSCSRLPFRYLLSILKSWLEYIDWTSPDKSAS